MATINTDPPRGMRDLLPHQVNLRDWASSVIQNTYRKFGFTRIETPVMENIQHLRGAEGGENLQLIYEVLKRGEKLDRVKAEVESGNLIWDELTDLGLRFDLTVPLVRYYSSNNANLPTPLKAIQIGSVFRAESPQRGRFRQFTQCDIDIIGVKSELAEMELINATAEALYGLGFTNFQILINDRRFLSALAENCGFKSERISAVFIALDKLDKIGLDKVLEELTAVSSDEASVAKLSAVLKAYLEKQDKGQLSFADMEEIFPELFASEYMQALQKIVAAVESCSEGRYQIRFDPTLVRGMGYYTGPIFEVKNPGYSGSIAGGGRYDKMVGKFSGREVPACGFSIGFERVIDILTENGLHPPSEARRIALVVDPDRDNGADVLKAAAKLRREGDLVSIQPRKKDMKKQLDSLLEHGYTQYCAFRGDPENLELKTLSR